MEIKEGKTYLEKDRKFIVKVKRVILPYMNQYSDLDNLLGLVEWDVIEGYGYGSCNSTYRHFYDNFQELSDGLKK